MRRTLKVLGFGFAGLLVLVVIAYFVISSGWFVRSQVLPRITAATGMPLSVDGVSFSPFSRLELLGVRAGDPAKPLATIRTLRVSYSMLALLHKTLKVDEFLLDGATIAVEQNPDGTWKLPQPPAAAAGPAPAQPGAEKKTGASPLPFTPEIRNVEIRDLTVTVNQGVIVPADALQFELRRFNLKLPELRPHQPVRLEWSGEFKAGRGAGVQIPAATLNGTLQTQLGENLLPEKSTTMDVTVAVQNGKVQDLPLSGHEFRFHLAAAPEKDGCRIEQCRLTEQGSGETDFVLNVTGVIRPEPLEASLQITADPIAPAAFNLAGGLAGGMNFGRTSGRYQGSVEFRNGKTLAAKGELSLSQITVTSPRLQLPAALPPMEFALVHDVNVNAAEERATIAAFHARLATDNHELLRIELSEPAQFAWGRNGKTGGAGAGVTGTAATVRLTVADLDLAMLAPFLPASTAFHIQGGTLNSRMEVVAADMGTAVAVKGSTSVRNLRGTLQGKPLPSMDITLVQDVDANLAKAQATIRTFSTRVDLNHRGVLQAGLAEPAQIAWGRNGKTDAPASAPKIRLAAGNVDLALLAPFLPASGAFVLEGGVFSANVETVAADMGATVTVRGSTTVRDLRGTLQGKPLPSLGLQNDFDLKMTGTETISGTIRERLAVRDRQALDMTVEPNLNAKTMNGTVRLHLQEANHALLELAPAGAASPGMIREFAVGGDFSADLREQGKAASVQGRLELARLVTVNPESGIANAPVQGRFDVDAGFTAAQEIVIRRGDVTLSSANQPLLAAGVAGNFVLPPVQKESVLRITASRIDGTALQALFAAPKAKASPATGDAASAPAGAAPAATGKKRKTAAEPETEPPALNFGGLWLTADLDLNRITYGEINVARVSGTVKVKDNKLAVKPLDITLNGTPVQVELSADFNRPGWQYAAKSSFTNLDLAPFIATFAPDMKDSCKGSIKSFNLDVRGAGITPTSLGRNFTGGATLVGDGVEVHNLKQLIGNAAGEKSGMKPLVDLLLAIGLDQQDEIVFDTTRVRMEAADGRMQVREAVLASPDILADVGGSLGFDQTLDLQLKLGFGGSLEQRMRGLRLSPLLGEREGRHAIMPYRIPIRGSFAKPKADFNVKKVLTQAGINAGLNILGEALKAKEDGKKVDAKDLLKSFLDGNSSKPAEPAGNVQPAPAETVKPAAPPAETPKGSDKRKRNQDLIDLGGSLLNQALQGK